MPLAAVDSPANEGPPPGAPGINIGGPIMLPVAPKCRTMMRPFPGAHKQAAFERRKINNSALLAEYIDSTSGRSSALREARPRKLHLAISAQIVYLHA